MHIVDKHLVGGSGTVDWVVSYPESSGTSSIPNNYGNDEVQVVGAAPAGSYRRNAKNFRVNASGSDFSWNRMSDGCLIMDQTLGLSLFDMNGQMYSNSLSNEDAMSMFQSEYATKEQPGESTNYNVDLFTWKATLPSFLGASYTLKELRIGFNGSLNALAEAPKYFTGVDFTNDNWHLDKQPFYDTFCKLGSNGNFGVVGMVNSGGITTGYLYRTQYHAQGARLIAVPNGTVPSLSPMDTSLGVITVAPSPINVSCAVNADFAVYLDGTQKSTSNGTSVQVNIGDWWGDLGLGKHEVRITSEAGGYRCGAMIRFQKSTSLVSVQGNPISFGSRPSMVYMADNLTIPSGASVLREVCNNANDSSPTWEEYEGERHSFGNFDKTSSNWALGWRISIDNSNGNAQAKISTGVNVGVLTDGGEGPIG